MRHVSPAQRERFGTSDYRPTTTINAGTMTMFSLLQPDTLEGIG
jgi:hypothetical protein